MELKGLQFEKKGHIGILTLNRPEKMNILDHRGIEEMDRFLTELEFDTDIRCLVLTGKGKAFCAGADVGTEASCGPYEIEYFSHIGKNLMEKIACFRAPVIGAINGHALGGGLEMTLSCDYRIASERASFGSPEITLSTLAGWGGVQKLASVIGKSQAKRLLFTGMRIRADEALRLGLVDEVKASEEVLPAALEMAETISGMAPLAMELMKKAIREGKDFNVKEIGQLYVTEDSKEAYAAFMEKRPNRGYHRR